MTLTKLEMKACPHDTCGHFVGQMRLGSFRCIHCQDKIDSLKSCLDKFIGR